MISILNSLIQNGQGSFWKPSSTLPSQTKTKDCPLQTLTYQSVSCKLKNLESGGNKIASEIL